MKHCFLLILLFLFQVNGASASLTNDQEKQFELELSQVKPSLFNQIIDHAHPELGSYQQRYFVYSGFVKSANPPVLMVICGEWTCGARDGYSLGYYANEVGAQIIMLEHRFYGASQPFQDFSTDHLSYLTLNQALDDISYFQSEMKKNPSFGGPWVMIGGSAGGTYAALFRALHPDQAVGAIAHSPATRIISVHGEMDDLIKTILGPECSKNLKTLVKEEFEPALKSEAKIQELKKDLDTFGPSDVNELSADVYESLESIIQQGLKSEICSSVQKSVLLPKEQRLQAFANMMIDLEGISPTQLDAIQQQLIAAYIQDPVQLKGVLALIQSQLGIDPTTLSQAELLKDESQVILANHLVRAHDLGNAYDDVNPVVNYPDLAVHPAQRPWFYQTCTDWRHIILWPNPHPLDNIMPQVQDYAYQPELCQKVFGINTTPDMSTRMKKLFRVFLASSPEQPTHIFSTYGTDDPHTVYSITEELQNQTHAYAPGLTYYQVEGGAHMTLLYPPRDKDSSGVKEARAKSLENIKSWLGVK